MKTLVIDVPALRLSYLGCYGNDWVGTPNIDQFACEGIVFERHYLDRERSTEPTLGHTGGSVKLLQRMHEVVEQALAFDWRKSSLASCVFPSLAPPWQIPPDLLDAYCEDEDEPWLDPPRGAVANPDDLPRLQNTYAALVTHVDAHLGALFESLRERHLLDHLHIWLTSSHGLPLGEHGFIGDAEAWPHEETAHLPLLLRLPHAEHAGFRLNALTQPSDLLATLTGPPNKDDALPLGHSLWPLVRGEVEQIRAHAVTALQRNGEEEHALRTLEWAFLLPMQNEARQPRLFVKPDDRWEVNDVRQHHLELAEEMEKMVRAAALRPRDDGASPKR